MENKMKENELIYFMSYKNKTVNPLFVTNINSQYILAAYRGSISEYDILIKYRQKINNNWSRIRTPKHIHWAVDILLKMHADTEKTKDFLNFLMKMWDNTFPIKNKLDRKKVLNINYLIESNKESFHKYKELSQKGEYSIKFLILLAKLLMIQEKTNLETAYMFKNLIQALKSGKDIFKIVSIATHR